MYLLIDIPTSAEKNTLIETKNRKMNNKKETNDFSNKFSHTFFLVLQKTIQKYWESTFFAIWIQGPGYSF